MTVCRLGLLLLCCCAAPALTRGQDVYVLMTLHNLGCRQADHTYTGMIPANSFDEGDRVEVILAGANGVSMRRTPTAHPAETISSRTIPACPSR